MTLVAPNQFSNPAYNQVSSGDEQSRILANAVIGFAVFLGGFVIIEPAPYEVFISMLLFLWTLLGMRYPREALLLLFLFALFNFGGVISSMHMREYWFGLNYVAVSFFLALSSVFFANVISEDMYRLRVIYRGYTLAAVVTSMLGIIGYFGFIPGFEIFTRYTRAMGAFQDPNVYAPFIVAPILYLIYGIVNRNPVLLPVRAGMLAILLLGLFLAFSRAAWGLFLFCAITYYFLMIVTEQTNRARLRFVVLAVVGAAAIVLLLVIALQFDAVSKLFLERAKVVQDYDGGRIGRFARHLIGFNEALVRPFGMGPLQFGVVFGEDTHNNLVKALMAHGWIGFISWIAVMGWTIYAGFKLLFKQRPWLPYFQIAYVVFIGHTLIGNVIDTDHWRHFFLLIGIIWGCMILERKWQQDRQSGQMNSGNYTPPSAPVPSLLSG